MPPLPQFHRAILDAAAQGGLILTVNKRLSRHLRALFDDRMRKEGRGAWRTPEIVDLNSWLQGGLAGLGEDFHLLGKVPSLRLWEEIIEADTAGTELGLLQVAATAKRAVEAHQMLTEYGADIAGLPLTEDHAAFMRWRQQYLDACRGGGWLDAASLPARICAAIRRGDLPAPTRVLLVGFDEVTPKVQKLCAALAFAGSAVEELPPPAEPRGKLVRMPCADIADEVRCAARWARHLLEAGEEKIGIIVPNLYGYRPHIERIFRAEIDPGALLCLDEEEVGFSLSLGSGLSYQGLVVAAFEVLAAGFSLPMDRASLLLRTPYLGGSQEETHGRALLERTLRSYRTTKFRLKYLKDRADGGKGKLPQLAKIIQVVEDGLQDRGKRSPGEWVKSFSRLLEGVGWPGGRPLSSLEYQVYKAWREKLLPAMVSLEAIAAPMERGEALSLLRRLAKEIDFQPETPAGPLQVVGHLEAAGLHFDHLWVMGLAEDALPAPARPNPFIPVSLQVARGMPHASAERELDFARKVVRRLFAGAPRVILSHPCREGDCDLRPSPLVAQVEAGTVPLAPVHAPETVVGQQNPVLVEVVDEQGPCLDAAEKAGGTAILKDQALCPFRAFAHHRLAARALEAPEIGLDAGTRGTLLHKALEQFWEKTKGQGDLLALGEKGLLCRIEGCVEGAIGEVFSDRQREAPEALLAIERQRLTSLVREWLDALERARPPFVVAGCEKDHAATFGGLTIGTKVDRIDELADGRRVILDYKTGRIDLGDLLGSRLVEPQLPIYGLGATGENLAGVAFASVRRGECTLKGVARGADLLPGTEAFAGSRLAEKHGIADWPELLEHWRAQLEKLGAEFVRGEASVTPVDPQKACQFCDLHALCRIDEIGMLRGVSG